MIEVSSGSMRGLLRPRSSKQALGQAVTGTQPKIHSLIGILSGGRQMARSAAQTRQRILDAAYGLFWRNGFVRASIDDIAARARITKRTFYQHFRSKDDLMAVVLTHASDLALE